MVSNPLSGLALYDSQNEKMVGSEGDEFLEKTLDQLLIPSEVLHIHVQRNSFG